MQFDADGALIFKRIDPRTNGVPHLDDIAADHVGNANADGRLAIAIKEAFGRILHRFMHICNIFQPEAFAGFGVCNPHIAQILDRPHTVIRAERDPKAIGFHRPARDDQILSFDHLSDLIGRQAQLE